MALKVGFYSLKATSPQGDSSQTRIEGAGWIKTAPWMHINNRFKTSMIASNPEGIVPFFHPLLGSQLGITFKIHSVIQD